MIKSIQETQDCDMMNGESFRKNFKIQLDDNPCLVGLDTFKRSLEKDYFARVSVRNCNSEQSVDELGLGDRPWNLVIDMECNFNLVEILYYLEKGSWGHSASTCPGGQTFQTAFAEAMFAFNAQNSVNIDVEELSIVLKDTIIVIKRIHNQSISEQLGEILQSLGAHYVHLTRNLTETPYEIYLPVFEEEVNKSDFLITNVKRNADSARDYFGYWALYFDSMEEAKIYDLENKTIISGDLHMLNH